MRKYNIHWIIKKIGRLELPDFQNLNPPIEKKSLLDIYRLEDADGTEITLDQLVEKYFSDPETCFIKDDSETEGFKQ